MERVASATQDMVRKGIGGCTRAAAATRVAGAAARRGGGVGRVLGRLARQRDAHRLWDGPCQAGRGQRARRAGAANLTADVIV